jgi:uncharacterized membrane protein
MTLWRSGPQGVSVYLKFMPYKWSSPPEHAQLWAKSSHQPGLRLSLSAHNALSREGFAGFIGATACLMAVPLLAFLGHTVLWVIATALGSALCAIWLALKASWRRGQVREEFELWSDLAVLRRINPNGQLQEWRANPYWVEVQISKDDGPVPQYLTLRGGGRVVEIGAFLSQDERPVLATDLQLAFLNAARHG